MPSRASTRRGLLISGLFVVILLGAMDGLLRREDSVIASLWNELGPAPSTPIERAMRRLPRR